MSEAAAVLTSAPLPATTPAAAPAAAVPAPAAKTEPAAPQAAPGKAPATNATGKARARELAAQILSGNKSTPTTAPASETPPGDVADAAPAAEEPPVDPKATKTKPKPPTKAEQKAAEEEAAKKVAEEAAAKEKEDEEKLEKGFKELHRQRKLQKKAKQEEAAWRAEQAQMLAEKRADDELRERNPEAWLDKHRFDFRDVAKKAIDKEAETPETKAQRERDAKNAELQRRLDELEAERADERQRIALQNIRTDTLKEWETAKSGYPTLATYYTPDDIEQAATKLRTDHFRNTRRADALRRGVPEEQGRGEEASLEDAFAHMEKMAKRDHERFSRKSEATQTSDRTERETVEPQGSKPRATVGPSVTNSDSATRASPPANLTPAERRERAAAKAEVFFRSRP